MSLKWILHLGDSLSTGFPNNHGAYWPSRANALKTNLPWGIDPFGVPGERLDQMATRWTSQRRGRGHSHVSIWGGINDVLQDATAATAYGRLKGITDAAKADGQALVVCTLAPFKGYVGYSAGRETQRIAFNALVRAAVLPGGDMAGAALVDLDAALKDPGDAQQMLAAYADSDKLHLSSAGEDAVAAAYGAAVT